MPRALAERADRGRKHRDNLRYELAILWRRYVTDGEFRLSMRMLDELYTAHFRRVLKSILDETTTPVRNHSSYSGNARSRSYKFRFRRPIKAPTYSDIQEVPDATAPLPTELIRVVIPAAWLWDRYLRWTDICERQGWTPSLDLDGRTDWGRPLFAALDSTRVPDVPETQRLTHYGVLKAARRKRGRCYHSITNLRKSLRRESLIDGEPTAEVDIHACYTAILISRLPDGAAKRRAITEIQVDWYSQFGDAYSHWFYQQCDRGRAYISELGEWIIRLDDNPKHDALASIKVEYQRQCLFFRDPRDESNPFRVSLRHRHAEFCRLIESLRQHLTPTELSDVLTRAEGSLVVDSATAELERAGITVISIHDGVVVPVSRANEAREVLLDVCEWHLGFAPRVSIKTSETDRRAMIFDNVGAHPVNNGNDCRQSSHSQRNSHARNS